MVLSAPQLVQMALQRDKTYLGRRYVEVFRCRKHDYYRAVSILMAENPEGPGGPGGGPPHHANYQAAQYNNAPQPQRVAEVPSVPDCILKLRGLPFSATVHDIVQFFSDPQLTLSQPVDLSQCVYVALFALKMGLFTFQSARTSTCPAHSVHVASLADGRPSGQAFVEFASEEDAQMALRKNRATLGTRYVEMFPAKRDEMNRTLGL